MKFAYSYIRMSTEAQLKGDSLRRQIEGSQKYAEKHGLTLVEFKPDIGVSAFRGDNVKKGALGEFMGAVRSGSIPPGSVLIAESLDRISREKIEDALQTFLEIIAMGITLVTLQDERVFKKGEVKFEDLLISLSIMQRSNEESERKSDRLAQAWRNKRDYVQEKKLTSRCPAWLNLADDKVYFEIDRDKAKVVNLIFNQAMDGKGAHLITRHLNANRVPTLTRSEKWEKSYVTKILKNRAVLGEFQPHVKRRGKRVPEGEIIYSYFPPIISKEQFALVAAARRSRANSGGGRRGTHQTNLFTHLLACCECGARYRYINKGKEGRYLQCLGSFNGRDCPARPWRYADFEVAFLSFVRELDLKSLLATTKDEQDKERLRASIVAGKEAIAQLNAKMKVAADDIAHPSLGAFYRKKLEEWSEELGKIQKDVIAAEEGLLRRPAYNISPTELSAYVDTFQSAASDRFKLASRIKQIVKSVTITSIPLKGTVEDVVRWFEVEFRDATWRWVWPDPTDPAKFKMNMFVDPDRRAAVFVDWRKSIRYIDSNTFYVNDMRIRKIRREFRFGAHRLISRRRKLSVACFATKVLD